MSENSKNDIELNNLWREVILDYFMGEDVKTPYYSQKDLEKTTKLTALRLMRVAMIRGNYSYGKDSITFSNFRKALRISTKLNDTSLVRLTSHFILDYIFNSGDTYDILPKYYGILNRYKINKLDESVIFYYTSIKNSILDNSPDFENLNKADSCIKGQEYVLQRAKILQFKGALQSHYNLKQDNAIKTWKQALALYKKVSSHKKVEYLFSVNNNIAVAWNMKNELDSSFFYYNKAGKLGLSRNKYLKWAYYHQGKANLFKHMESFDSAFVALDYEKKNLKRFHESKSEWEKRDIDAKYQTAEKEKQILEEQQKVRTNRNWLIAACLALFLGAGIAVLFQKNTTKKRLLAEQEALLKQERVDNLLKEQELVSIDAMIAGQEKERQRVANELHDDLGSLMATIKLHFDNSKVSKKDPALKNAQKLLEEAYQKVRSMAHSKNSGVMSDQGLLPAIKKMAQVITETNALKVAVEDFGMGDRLENSLELNLFRMVQELVANAIKHAEATKVTIQLTQHEDNLNIIIEDNGKGFDRSKIETDKTGMGLTTIEKRVEHLEGNFTIDSILGKGTSILIDIPV
ncbi:sensor histidine kinase [uncultured Croceitalea sp.]|uniref:sensor histidine kinase n=1 Tax=uncultured Croceitalea sp. TaxID=1798908 RepID=UPI003305994E